MTTPCALTDKSADHLQTISDPMVGFFSVGVRTVR